MALHNMAIQPAIHGQATLHIYQVARFPLAQVAFFQGFGNSGNPVTVALHFFYCKTNPVVANALVNGKFVGEGRTDPKSGIASVLADLFYPACCFYDPCKHAAKFGFLDVCWSFSDFWLYLQPKNALKEV
jgi:hypothetical protein